MVGLNTTPILLLASCYLYRAVCPSHNFLGKMRRFPQEQRTPGARRLGEKRAVSAILLRRGNKAFLAAKSVNADFPVVTRGEGNTGGGQGR